ncbi:hypothetical protein PCANC_23172 [Puccinia coronata f. sp. avenae]|uniref:Alpha-1,3-glucosyltransferase n=1 Tax=Puccinia coronata f. sp. avenae TaxID=200324 RepID=A0A2N5U0C1_9BASI|nr:hypothetical protein PCANC_23172 [Puccinia coronata f. sp. avenae]
MGLLLALPTAERNLVLFSTAAKLLLIPAYRSTDFEVHRNWLAVTHSLPLAQWYYDETSPWTLDYPPFFAFFEHLLARLAVLVDPKIVQLDSIGYEAWTCVAFQRITVILTELVFVAALIKLTSKPSKSHNPTTATAITASLLLHPALIIVDHIHFQYNGFLLGILLWSIWAAREKRFCLSALLFASLLNLKHIFIYLAPPYLVYLFRAYCMEKQKKKKKGGGTMGRRVVSFARLIQLASIVAGTCAASFGPFFIAGGLDAIQQILRRLFPFQRGLNHAYWAGNFWALYTACDRILLKYQLARGLRVDPSIVHSTSRGLIGDTVFGVLPPITPNTCLSVTLGFMIIVMSKLWQDPTYTRFLKSIILSALTSFLFGWHVHEKAALLFLVPLTLIAAEDYYLYRTWLVASMAGISGLFPLLIRSTETPFKLIFTFIWLGTCSKLFKRNLHRPSVSNLMILVTKLENLYVFGAGCLHCYVWLLHGLVVAHYQIKSMEFLPLMVISSYTSLGIIWSFFRLLFDYFLRSK